MTFKALALTILGLTDVQQEQLALVGQTCDRMNLEMGSERQIIGITIQPTGMPVVVAAAFLKEQPEQRTPGDQR